MRILITGPPQSGKSTLAMILSDVLEIPVYATDQLKDLEWSEASEAASRWLDDPGPWIIEGVMVPRALRKWRRRQPKNKQAGDPPCEKFILLTEPRTPLEKAGQRSMATSVLNLAMEYEEWLGNRWIED